MKRLRRIPREVRERFKHHNPWALGFADGVFETYVQIREQSGSTGMAARRLLEALATFPGDAVPYILDMHVHHLTGEIEITAHSGRGFAVIVNATYYDVTRTCVVREITAKGKGGRS